MTPVNDHDTPLKGESTGSSGLRVLQALKPLYLLPDDSLAEDVLIPSFSAARSVDSMVGFFSSQALVPLAPGLATFINNSTGTIRLIISPFLKAEDKQALEQGVLPPESVATSALQQYLLTEDEVQQHTLRCLSWLIQIDRIQIKVALMKGALFHPKVWLFHGGDDTVAVHGSSNFTYSGVTKNIEQVAVSKSWEDNNQEYVTGRLELQFDDLWEQRNKNSVVLNLPQAVKRELLEAYYPSRPPQEEDLRVLTGYEDDSTRPTTPGTEIALFDEDCFAIPEGLEFEQGPFQHQGAAVRAWLQAGCQGILEMATGSGKTITAMIGAYQLYQSQGSLLIVIAAPYVPLLEQWCEEIRAFGIAPINLSAADGVTGRARALGRIRRALRSNTPTARAVVVSHDTLCDNGFKAELREFDCATLLVADEVHNLGRPGFVADPPEFFDYRLGLSATPVRQYDETGTEGLVRFFGPIVFRFTLEEAIGKCLVPYDYFVHIVELTKEEKERWNQLTNRIRANSWRVNSNEQDEYLLKLYRDRRAVLESATGKIELLERHLQSRIARNIRHTLIYASDKDPQQLLDVNGILHRLGVQFHQLTYEETGNRTQTTNILRDFAEGSLRILTAKRVLDEGVNMPQVREAYILASTTVERQWVQRRGRLLRRCDEIGKTHSTIHDFVVVPDEGDEDTEEERSVINSELRRVRAFARLAQNAGRLDGPLVAMNGLAARGYL